MRTPLLVLAGTLAVLPAVASAQSDAQRRMDDLQRRMAIAEADRRLDDVERRVDTLDLRVRTQEAQRDLDILSTPLPAPTAPWIAPAAPALPADLAQAAQRREASLAASDARLRDLAQEQKR